MRHFLRYILFLLLVPSLSAQPARPSGAKPDSSTWWYPLGAPEATRRNPAPTNASSPSDLVIKWRTTTLKNSPVTLVGGLLQKTDDDSTQQIVGMERGSNVLTMLNHRGMLDTFQLYNNDFETEVKLSLTGLFNRFSPTFDGIGRPNLIGIGAERHQRSAPGSSTIYDLFGFLAGPNGAAIRRLKIDTLPSDPVFDNQSAGIYPVAALTPAGTGSEATVLTLVSQNDFHGSETSLRNANGLWHTTLRDQSGQVDSNWKYPVAPRTYPQQPAMTTDATGLAYVGLSTASLREPKVNSPSATDALNQPIVTTASNDHYSITVRVEDERAPWQLGTVSHPLAEVADVPHNDTIGETDTYFIRMDTAPWVTTDTFALLKVVTTNFDSAPLAVPSINISPAKVNTKGALFYDKAIRNIGWTIVAANLDGSDSANPLQINPPPTYVYPRNYGDELVAAYRYQNNPTADVDTNILYVFRYYTQNSLQLEGSRLFWHFARWRFSGRLMAAGDLIKDAANRQELVIAGGNKLHVIRMRPYNTVLQGIADDLKRRWFDTVASFNFDSPVVSVAIADLEGNGYNDIIVTTKKSTYGIGKPIPQPLGKVTIADSVYCPGDPATVTWGPRAVGGGEEGVEIIARAADNTEIPIADSIPMEPSNDKATTYSFPLPTLPPGTYSILVRDRALPTLEAQQAGVFTITQPSIDRVDLPLDEYRPQETIRFVSAYRCAEDHLALERSDENDTAWYMWPAIIRYNPATDSAEIETSIPCFDPCSVKSPIQIRFRLRDTVAAIAPSSSDEFSVTIPVRTLALDADTGTTRKREVIWTPESLDCKNVRITLTSNGTLIGESRIFPTRAGRGEVEVPSGFSGKVDVQLCCEGPVGDACSQWLGRFSVSPMEQGTYVQPNPFDPNFAGGTAASIFYTLDRPGSVTITIFDASRAVVRQLLSSAEREAGVNMEQWDGRNSQGEIVANGTYICIITSGSGKTTPLPIFVAKH